MDINVLEPVFVGIKGSSYPTTRPDGSALQNGDYVGITGSTDVYRYINGNWVLGACVWQNSESVPLSSDNEGLQTTDRTQYDYNVRMVARLNRNKYPVGSIGMEAECQTASVMGNKYGGTWTLVSTHYGDDYQFYQSGNNKMVFRRQNLLTTASYMTAQQITKGDGNYGLGFNIATKWLSNSSLGGNSRVSLPVGFWGVGMQFGSIWINTGTLQPQFESYFGSKTATYMGNVTYPSRTEELTVKFRIWRRTA